MGVSLRTPWDTEPAPSASPDPPEPAPPPARPRGRRPADARAVGAGPLDWRYHHLTVRGPDAEVGDFAAAARGAGVIPWRLDAARLEEDVFTLAVAAPPSERRLSVAGCRILARQFRARLEAHHALAVARVGRSLACPLDLHALLPVPDDVLRLGPTDPAALAWMAAHWGTTDRLRQASERPPGTGRRLPPGHRIVGYGFFTAGETPHTAIAGLAARWPGLDFVLRPMPAD